MKYSGFLFLALVIGAVAWTHLFKTTTKAQPHATRTSAPFDPKERWDEQKYFDDWLSRWAPQSELARTWRAEAGKVGVDLNYLYAQYSKEHGWPEDEYAKGMAADNAILHARAKLFAAREEKLYQAGFRGDLREAVYKSLVDDMNAEGTKLAQQREERLQSDRNSIQNAPASAPIVPAPPQPERAGHPHLNRSVVPTAIPSTIEPAPKPQFDAHGVPVDPEPLHR